ncbi:DUF4172 domain-containing protein [Aeromonas caviae]|uniref:DUF4172 domain-containing protein n=1 Tax=Aeromonas caviae TaxID=648 RepID=UPI0039774ADE
MRGWAKISEDWIWQHEGWPHFCWQDELLQPQLRTAHSAPQSGDPPRPLKMNGSRPKTIRCRWYPGGWLGPQYILRHRQARLWSRHSPILSAGSMPA